MQTTPRFTRKLALVALFILTACGGAQTTAETPTTLPASEAPVAEVGERLLTIDTEVFEVSGAQVIFKRTPAAPTVSVQFLLGSGSWATPAEHAGADDLAIGVVTGGGPASMEKIEFASALEALGSSIGGGSDYDYARVSVSSVRPFLEETWALFVETTGDPAFREAELDLQRERHLTGLRTEMDDPDSAVGLLAKGLLFDGHAYSVRPIGDETTIASFDAETLRAAWEGLWQPAHATVVVVGDLERADVEAMIAEVFDGAAPASAPEHVARAGDGFTVSEPTVHVEPRVDIPTNYILGYFAAPDRTHPDFAALQIGMEILSDRLFEEVRTERNLSYAVSAGLGGRAQNSGYLYVTATQPNVTLQVMLDTVQTMIDEPVSEQDLHDQIAGYLTRTYMSLQTPEAQAGRLGAWAALGGDAMLADAHIASLRAVTPADVSRVLDTYLRNLQIVVLGHPDQIDTTVFTQR